MDKRMGPALGVGALVLALVLGAIPARAATEAPIVVGRLAHVDGDVLRYIPDEDDWVASVKDTPLASKDVFYSDSDGRAEFTFPNGSMVRLGGATQVEVSNLENDLTDLYVASGQARFFNRSKDNFVRASTEFGYLVLPPGARADLYVGDESAEMISLGGACEFIHTRDGFESKFDVTPGSSLLVDRDSVGPGDGTVDADWDRWNGSRDAELARRPRVRTAQYLPEPLWDDAPVLQEHGRWQRVYYDGSYRQLWRPTVVAGWSPFSVGRWTEWRGDQVWVPYEPFGYVTHHYGNWVMVGGGWYWAPPVVSVAVGVTPPPLYWYPGRVAWVHSPDHIGWVPLAPHETYYAHYGWGPSAVLATATAAAVTLGTLAFLNHAVLVGHHDFYGGHHHRGYHGVMVKNVSKTLIINNYSGSAVVHKRILRDADWRHRHRFVDRDVSLKPHRTVVRQMKERQERARVMNASALRGDLQKARKGQLAEGRKVKEPRLTNRLVRTGDVDKPQAQFREGKPKGRAEKPKVTAVQGDQRPKRGVDKSEKVPKERPPGWDKGRKEGWTGDKPPGLEKQTTKPGKVEKPDKAGKVERPEKAGKVQRPEKPGRPERLEKPGKVERPEKPARPEGLEKSGQQQGRQQIERRERRKQQQVEAPPKERRQKQQQVEAPPKERRQKQQQAEGERPRKGKAKKKGEGDDDSATTIR